MLTREGSLRITTHNTQHVCCVSCAVCYVSCVEFLKHSLHDCRHIQKYFCHLQISQICLDQNNLVSH